MSEIIVENNNVGEGFLDCAEQIAQTIDNVEGRSEIMSLIAVRYVELNLPEIATELAETIDDPYMRDQALASIATQCVTDERADYACKLLESIEDDNLYALATEQIALKCAEVGAFEKSIEIASQLSDSDPTFAKIVLIYADRGFFDEAVGLARSIDDADLKAPALTQLAAKAIHDKRNAESTELLLESTSAADETELLEERINTLIEIAALYKEIGQEDRALEILSRAHHLCGEVEGPMYVGAAKTFAKNVMLVQIVKSFAQLQRYDRADLITEEIEDPFLFASALTETALEHHKADQTAKALTLLAQALEIAREEEVVGEHGLRTRDRLLAELAVSYTIVSPYEEALQITRMMSSHDQRHSTLEEVAKLCVRDGNNNAVFRAAAMITDAYPKVLYFIKISDAFAASEQLEFADHMLFQALENAELINQAYDKASALMEIAVRFARKEQSAKALALFFQSLTTAAGISNNYLKARALLELSDKYREARQEAGEREHRILQEMILESG